ncbi:hypothetical protein Q3G72_011490 [Acer saccharum]|nr:hypothetical protein Q3G72_011490 [Acer saccharum]
MGNVQLNSVGQQPEKERKEEKKREIVVAGLAESAAPLAVDADALACRRRLSYRLTLMLLLPSFVEAAAFARRRHRPCSSTPSPSLVDTVFSFAALLLVLACVVGVFCVAVVAFGCLLPCCFVVYGSRPALINF